METSKDVGETSEKCVIEYTKRKQSSILVMFGANKKKHTEKYDCDGCNGEEKVDAEQEKIQSANLQKNLEALRIAEACSMWQDRWIIDYRWLEFNKELARVYCKVCKQHPNRFKNVFGTLGSTNIRASAWLDHGRSKVHRDIYRDQIEAEKTSIQEVNSTIHGSKRRGVVGLV
ncbi:hypothetical protein O6H91_01G121000 [Diphasiastrum complanatum]|uniref:Uncharacterized protein n=1 Tax=Diphasiastrum complanatum TaxID=34168 RepID=A0ACC2EVF2_DIPCM|nr:hypothetical protein O6H91_01G121000 [Diphasiastrum complanatum]